MWSDDKLQQPDKLAVGALQVVWCGSRTLQAGDR